MKKSISLLSIILLCSCGARKVSNTNSIVKENITTQTTKIDTSKTVTEANSNIKITDSSTTDEVVIEAKDTTKPFTINGQTYRNAVLKQKKVKNNITTNETKNIKTEAKKHVLEQTKTSTNKLAVVKVKNTERSTSYWWLLWFLLLIPIYFIWKKYGKYILLFFGI